MSMYDIIKWGYLIITTIISVYAIFTYLLRGGHLVFKLGKGLKTAKIGIYTDNNDSKKIKKSLQDFEYLDKDAITIVTSFNEADMNEKNIIIFDWENAGSDYNARKERVDRAILARKGALNVAIIILAKMNVIQEADFNTYSETQNVTVVNSTSRMKNDILTALIIMSLNKK